jgi:hypothetical protein
VCVDINIQKVAVRREVGSEAAVTVCERICEHIELQLL